MNDQLLDTELEQPIASRELRKLVEYATNLFLDLDLGKNAVTKKLLDKGHSEDTVITVVQLAIVEVNAVNRKKAIKDIIVGALFLVLGLVLTLANIGFIFYGAIIFGGIQCVRGIINLSNHNN